MYAIIHLKHSGNVEKSDEKQEMQSTENAQIPLNFERTKEGLNFFHSARFKYI